MLLKKFAESVENTSPTDDAAFRDAITTGMELMNLSNKDMAHQFGLSQPTLERWLSGQTAPHTALRSNVFHFLANLAKSKELCAECGHEAIHHESWYRDDGDLCTHGAYQTENGLTGYPCNCGNNIGR